MKNTEVFLEINLSKKKVKKARILILKEEIIQEKYNRSEWDGNREEKPNSCLEECKKDEIKRFIQGRGCYSTFGWVPSIASLITLLQLLLSNVIKKSE